MAIDCRRGYCIGIRAGEHNIEEARLNDETLEEIQAKIAYLERAVADLSDVVFRQHREIQTHEAKLKALSERLSGVQTEERTRTLEHERPPHY